MPMQRLLPKMLLSVWMLASAALLVAAVGCKEKEQPRRYEEGVVETERAKIEQIGDASPLGAPAEPRPVPTPPADPKMPLALLELPEMTEPIVVNPPEPPWDAGPPPARERPKQLPKPKPKETATTKYPILEQGADGFLSVQTRPWSKVYLNGKFLKNTPVSKHRLKPGVHLVKIENPQYGISKTFHVTIRPGKPTILIKTLI